MEDGQKVRGKDLAGWRSGKLVALYRTKKEPKSGWYWMCQCDCGNLHEVLASNLSQYRIKSCGCELGGERLDLTGRKFGKLRVLSFGWRIPHKGSWWWCVCECGNYKFINSNALMRGQQSCGCLQGGKGKIKPPRAKNLAGQRFNRLVVLGRANMGRRGNKQAYWLCRCDCGKLIEAPTAGLNNGDYQSCGCFKTDLFIQRNTKHGYSPRSGASKEYSIWQGMHKRANNKKQRHYGGRGIKVCKRWGRFLNFLEDMGECPPGHSLDRIDVNGHYCPENCRWATTITQNNNTRRNVYLIFNGRTQTLMQWSRELNIPYTTLQGRINALGWTDPIQILLTPVKKYHKKGAIHGL